MSMQETIQIVARHMAMMMVRALDKQQQLCVSPWNNDVTKDSTFLIPKMSEISEIQLIESFFFKVHPLSHTLWMNLKIKRVALAVMHRIWSKSNPLKTPDELADFGGMQRYNPIGFSYRFVNICFMNMKNPVIETEYLHIIFLWN